MPVRIRIPPLAGEQENIYLAWREYFGKKFARWAARRDLQPPPWYEAQGIEVNQDLVDIWEKRVIDVTEAIEAGIDREKAIKAFDRDTMKRIAILVRKGKDPERDNIFYELLR